MVDDPTDRSANLRALAVTAGTQLVILQTIALLGATITEAMDDGPSADGIERSLAGAIRNMTERELEDLAAGARVVAKASEALQLRIRAALLARRGASS